jgi:hypothetical protein
LSGLRRRGMGRLFFFVVPPNQVTFFVVFQL